MYMNNKYEFNKYFLFQFFKLEKLKFEYYASYSYNNMKEYQILVLGDHKVGKTAYCRKITGTVIEEEYKKTEIETIYQLEKIKFIEPALDDSFFINFEKYKYIHGIIIMYCATSFNTYTRASLLYAKVRKYLNKNIPIVIVENYDRRDECIFNKKNFDEKILYSRILINVNYNLTDPYLKILSKLNESPINNNNKKVDILIEIYNSIYSNNKFRIIFKQVLNDFNINNDEYVKFLIYVNKLNLLDDCEYLFDQKKLENKHIELLLNECPNRKDIIISSCEDDCESKYFILLKLIEKNIPTEILAK